MKNSRTGLNRLRAGLPRDWIAGDNTGAGANGAANDNAIVWPPDRAPILIATYLSGSPGTPEARDAHMPSNWKNSLDIRQKRADARNLVPQFNGENCRGPWLVGRSDEAISMLDSFSLGDINRAADPPPSTRRWGASARRPILWRKVFVVNAVKPGKPPSRPCFWSKPSSYAQRRNRRHRRKTSEVWAQLVYLPIRRGTGSRDGVL